MADSPKPRKRDHTSEYAKRKARRALNLADSATEEVDIKADVLRELQLQLVQLEKRTRHNPTDADGDIDFAYRNMALATVTPVMAPSTSAWEWYLFARNDRDEFLKICAKREDAKAKMAGTITNQRMEDDKRQQFAVIERIEKELTLDVKCMVKDLMDKFPRDVLRECKKYEEAWKSFHDEEC